MPNQAASATLAGSATVTASVTAAYKASVSITGLASITANTHEHETEAATLAGLASFTIGFPTITRAPAKAPPPPPPPSAGPPLRQLPVPILRPSNSIPNRRN